ncbi:serine hydrolase domain-containing protein [Rhizohabitans arisaemae]|uniref:serine hydrolase domain-containing protein n=1 Tax=Rhizohabitans arisaemae TaxID=2720610 RepID=UPI0024B0FAF0|nr:serine hydrolase domain-containing protein [Rhizohabitans arisaemae]
MIKSLLLATVLATDPTHVQAALDQALTRYGAPGIAAEVRDGRERWFGSAGFSDTETGRERRADERFRIGSATKSFTATVVLQLAGEGKLSLDDRVERWLPGLVRGNGHDGTQITVRQLLNHTSGIFNYVNDPELFAKAQGTAWLEHRYDTYTPKQLVRIAMRNPRHLPPGTGFAYSNTNYILAAMIVEKATGRGFGTEVTRRIIRPLKLTGTYLPGTEAKIRGPHPVHYSTLFSQEPDPTIHDATAMNQSATWSAGGMVSTLGDLNRFMGALLGGRLLPAAQQKEMFTTVETTGGPPWIPDTRYGLGVFTQKLPCGVWVWGNGGATYGSWTYAMGARDGKHLLATEVNGDWSGLGVFTDVLSAEFCPRTSR